MTLRHIHLLKQV